MFNCLWFMNCLTINWLVVYHILGMSSSQLTNSYFSHIFQRGRYTTNQIDFFFKHINISFLQGTFHTSLESLAPGFHTMFPLGWSEVCCAANDIYLVYESCDLATIYIYYTLILYILYILYIYYIYIYIYTYSVYIYSVYIYTVYI